MTALLLCIKAIGPWPALGIWITLLFIGDLIYEVTERNK